MAIDAHEKAKVGPDFQCSELKGNYPFSGSSNFRLIELGAPRSTLRTGYVGVIWPKANPGE